MKFAYRFSNLLGTVYKNGNLNFTPDGNSIISPVGNRLTIFDLRNNKSETLPIEAKQNISHVTLSPDGYTMIAVSNDGEAMLCSLISKSILGTHNFHRPIHCVKFSPNGKKFAVTRENMVDIFHAPGRTREFNPFTIYKKFHGAYDETTCIDWTSDSSAICVGSKDMNTRVYGAEKFTNLIVFTLGGHKGAIIGSFFVTNSLNVLSVSDDCKASFWESDKELKDLELAPVGGSDKPAKKKSGKMNKKGVDMVKYERTEKQKLRSGSVRMTCAAFHKANNLLVTGYSDGGFLLNEMPGFNLIHSLSISEQSVKSVDINLTGDWIGVACSQQGQLLVWEWQSESYVMKQQGHFNNMTCLEYSPDGQNIVTGGDDGKVKVWNTSSGFCFITFNEHLSGISGVAFSQYGQVVVSCSLDGTVRAFDLNRYRNFRTFTSPRPVQFSCLALDHSGEIVCAGGQDSFEIFVWSMQTGRLLEVLTGHQGPISCLSFSSSRAMLASASWDKTVKIWDVFESKGSKETIHLLTDVLSLTFRPDGQELAVSTLNGQISFWNPYTAVQIGSVEGRHDLGYSRKDTDKVTAKKLSEGKYFNTLCYSADGKCLLAGGQSKNICIYSVADQILMKKFEISCNRSFDGMEEYLDRRKMTEWGSLALVDAGEGEQDGVTLNLPGVKKGDLSSRHFKPEVRVACVRFSPTGRAFSATTTEGLLIYSLDHNLVFDPFELEMDITPANIRKTLHNENFSKALMLSFRLNEQNLVEEVIENIPVKDIDVICQNLPNVYIDKLLNFIATQIESSAHIQFYLIWLQCLLMQHGPQLKQRSQSLMATLRSLQKNVTRKYEDISKICDHNKYNLQFIQVLSQTCQIEGKRKHKTNLKDITKQTSDNESEEDSVSESEADINMALEEQSESDSNTEFFIP
ncbi:periodic tryptophan protein 2 homolog [Patella vulgata]|uniref:periodic tryptophan protein 2 homolog n=1 Tax=Patella vulgata TaxID=6465 RepID=UPI0021800F13|nr:periodic tryptophan protein 2 homolog [Patella vulgata]